jgi:Cell Wall Hydrolase
MGRSRLSWACSAIAPWCLGVGLVVSIAAEAGEDRHIGGSVAMESAAASIREGLASTSPGLTNSAAGDPAKPPLLLASLTLGAQDELTEIDDEVDPRLDLKKDHQRFPVVERALKGDPFLALRPGFDAKLNRPHAPEGSPTQSARAAVEDPFESVETALAYAQLPTDLDVKPWSDPDSNAKALSFDDGATPSVPMDIALNSSTPQPSDDTPILVVAATPEFGRDGVQSARVLPSGHPDYASLIDAKDATRQQRCLAEAVYFEARSESEEGQAAVAQVVLNRVRSGLYPVNVCAVVYQDRNRPFACQFSFACEGKSLRVTEPGPWTTATRIAQSVLDGKVYNPKVGAALNYHANYVVPYWASALKRVDQIGHHIFYQLRVSQN